jgi:hypothetical protein
MNLKPIKAFLHEFIEDVREGTSDLIVIYGPGATVLADEMLTSWPLIHRFTLGVQGDDERALTAVMTGKKKLETIAIHLTKSMFDRRPNVHDHTRLIETLTRTQRHLGIKHVIIHARRRDFISSEIREMAAADIQLFEHGYKIRVGWTS